MVLRTERGPTHRRHACKKLNSTPLRGILVDAVHAEEVAQRIARSPDESRSRAHSDGRQISTAHAYCAQRR